MLRGVQARILAINLNKSDGIGKSSTFREIKLGIEDVGT